MTIPPAFAAVDRYLGRLPDGPKPNLAMWRVADGSVQAQFFACALTSEFHPIHAIGRGASAQAVAFEGVARGVSPQDHGLSVWRMLDSASSDDESIELDRLCRVLHTINFFRQPLAGAGADLYLNVHDRLLAAVSSNHGDAFLRILHLLELSTSQIVLQLPPVGPASRWLVNYVADNYRRNGFRLALTAVRVREAIDFIGQLRPHAVAIDARAVKEPEQLYQLLRAARDGDVRVVVKRVETAATLALLEQVCREAATGVQVQGDWLDAPRPALPGKARQTAQEQAASLA